MFHPVDEPRRCLSGLVRPVESEFDEEISAAVWNEIQVRRALPAKTINHGAFEALEANGTELENFRDVVGRGKRVGISETDQRTVLRTVDQLQLCLEHDRARALGAHECPGDVKSVLGQQFVEVVSGHPPRNARESLANAIAVSFPECEQS